MNDTQHEIRYRRLPRDWADGLPLGNGEIGVMVWSDGQRLRFTLDHAEAWDLRCNPPEEGVEPWTYARLRDVVARGEYDATADERKRARDRQALGPSKVYLGRLDLDVNFDPPSTLALTLEDATLRGTLRQGEEGAEIEAFVARGAPVFALRLDPWPEGATLDLRPFDEASPGLAGLGHPEPAMERRGGLRLATVRILPDRFFTLCWDEAGPIVYVSVGFARDAETAKARALDCRPEQSAAGLRAFWEKHAAAWREFGERCEIALPDGDAESLWRMSLYTLASCARPGLAPPGLQGLWPMDGRNPPWKGDYHADLNIQQMFSVAYPTGHLDLVDAWLDEHLRDLPEAERLTREYFGTGGAFMVCSFLPGYTQLGEAWIRPVLIGWSHTGWLAQMAWLRWRYSMDADWLRRVGFPIVRSAFLFFAANLEEGEDGRLHVPLSSSPEYQESEAEAFCADPNIDLAFIRKCCDWIVEMEAELGLDDLTPRARTIHERLAPYHLVEFEHVHPGLRRHVEKGRWILALWKDKPLDLPHRHPSHLAPVFPAMDITIEGSDDDRRIIRNSLYHYLSLGQFFWAGHTYTEMVSLASVVGEAEMALAFLRRYRESWTLPSGLHLNREIGYRGDSRFSLPRDRLTAEAPFTVETTCGIGCGISDMLLQSWGGVIRLFPATPEEWSDALFVDLLAEGAFRVSALQREGSVRWARVRAERGGVAWLRDPFDGAPFTASRPPARRGDLLEWRLEPGEEVLLRADGGSDVDLAEQTRQVRALQRPPGPADCVLGLARQVP